MKDERRFKEVLRSVKSAEKDVDKFLKASRLERHERKPRFDSDDLLMLLVFATVWLLFILMFLGMG